MELRINKVSQACSGGSHVTIYEADIAFKGSEVWVVILRAEPQDRAPDSVEAAKEAIRRGAESVLRPRGMGAVILVERIIIHPVDFKPHQFERYTAEELTRLLTDPADREPPPPSVVSSP